MLESDDADDYIHAFQALSHGQPSDVEKFVCHLYGIKEKDHVDAARTAKLFALAGVTKKQFRIEDSWNEVQIEKGKLFFAATMLQGPKHEAKKDTICVLHMDHGSWQGTFAGIVPSRLWVGQSRW